MPKVKAIGAPMKTHAATMTTKNRIRLARPISASSGCASHNPPAIPPISATASRNGTQVVVSKRRSKATVAISPAPTRIATTRYPSEMCSVISSVERWTSRNC